MSCGWGGGKGRGLVGLVGGMQPFDRASASGAGRLLLGDKEAFRSGGSSSSPTRQLLLLLARRCWTSLTHLAVDGWLAALCALQRQVQGGLARRQTQQSEPELRVCGGWL